MSPRTVEAIEALKDLQVAIKRAQAALGYVYTTVESATACSLGTLAAAYHRAFLLIQDIEGMEAAA